MRKAVLIVAIICFAMAPAFADTIVGSVTFKGGVILGLEDGTPTSTLNGAKQVLSWTNTAIESTTLAGTVSGDAVTFNAPWSFDSGSVDTFWTVTGLGGLGTTYTFSLMSSAQQASAPGFVIVTGTGFLKTQGMEDTFGLWTFSTQNPSAFDQADPPNAVFSFSAGTEAPEPASLFLLGSGILGVGFLRRRK